MVYQQGNTATKIYIIKKGEFESIRKKRQRTKVTENQNKVRKFLGPHEIQREYEQSKGPGIKLTDIKVANLADGQIFG